MLCHDWTLVAPALEAVAQATSSGQIDPRSAVKAHARIERLRERLRENRCKRRPPPGVNRLPGAPRARGRGSRSDRRSDELGRKRL